MINLQLLIENIQLFGGGPAGKAQTCFESCGTELPLMMNIFDELQVFVLTVTNTHISLVNKRSADLILLFGFGPALLVLTCSSIGLALWLILLFGLLSVSDDTAILCAHVSAMSVCLRPVV